MLQSVSDFIFSKHCGCTPRGVRGVKRPEILWEIQKYSLPGRPSSQNWVKSKLICHFLRNFGEFLNDKFHGQGVLTINGVVKEGQFEDGKLIIN